MIIIRDYQPTNERGCMPFSLLDLSTVYPGANAVVAKSLSHLPYYRDN
jgi:hypothetical protein